MAPHHRKLANLEVKINDLERKYEVIKKILEEKFGAVVDVSLTSSTETEEHDSSSTSTTDDDLTNVPSNDSESLIPTDDATDYDKIDHDPGPEHQAASNDQSQKMIEDCYQKKLIVKISRLPLPLLNESQEKSPAIKRDYVVNPRDDDNDDIEFKLNSQGEVKTYANLMVANKNKKRKISPPPYKPTGIAPSPEDNSNDVQIVAVVNGQGLSQIPQNKVSTNTMHIILNKQEDKTEAELGNDNNRKLEMISNLKVETNEAETKQKISQYKGPVVVQESSKIIVDDLKPAVQNTNEKKEESDDDLTNEELFLCSYCNLDCVTQLGLGYHLSFMHSSSSQQKQNQANRNKSLNNKSPNFKCLDCQQLFSNEEGLSKHVKIHINGKKKQKKSTKEKCPQCDKLIERANLSRHVKQVHTGKTANTAPAAAIKNTITSPQPSPLIPSTPGSCEENVLEVFDEQIKPLCELCGVQFESKVQLEAHIKSIHEKKKPTFPCTEPNCNFVFSSKISLKNHSFTHLSEEGKAEYRKLNYAPCPICNKEYKKVSLKNHMKRHSSAVSSSLASPPSSTFIPSTISNNINISQVSESRNNLSLSVGNNNNNNLLLFNNFNEDQSSTMYSSAALLNSQQQVNNNINSMMMMNQQMISNSNCAGAPSQNVMNAPLSHSALIDHQFQPYKPVENFPSLDESFAELDIPMPMAEEYGIGEDIFQDIFTNITDDTFQDILSSVD